MKATSSRMMLPLERVWGSKVFSLVRGIGLNSVWLLLARGVVQVQLMLLTLLAARHLGQDGFGQYSLIASLVFLGNVLATFGTDTLLIRQVARAGRAEIPEARAAPALQLALSGLAIGGLWLWTTFPTQRSPEFAAALRLYSLSLIPLAFFSVHTAILRGFERMDLYLLVNLGTAAAQIAGVWLALQSEAGLLGLMGTLLVVQVLAMGLSFWLSRVAAGEAVRAGFGLRDLSFIPGLVRAAWPLAVLSVLAVAYQRLGIFSLSWLADDSQTGLYSAAARIVEAAKLGHMAVLGAVLPVLARLQAGRARQQTARRLTRAVTWGLFGLGFVLAGGLTFLAAPLVNLLYGTDYTAATPAVQALAWILLPYSLSFTMAVDLVAKRQEKRVLLAMSIGLGAAAGFSLWLIPVLGVIGACLAALAGECGQVLGLWAFGRRSEERMV